MNAISPTASPPKAYSYLRFSTPEQQKGDSFRRQTQLAADYAARKGLVLDDTLRLHDLGVSGFRGDNVETGKLGYFKEAVVAGEVPEGSYLLVESLDRISRQNARRAQRVLEDIADLGITVVTLIDEREYSRESMERDPIELILSILQFMRANEESATKSRRLKEAWSAKRSRSASAPLTSKVPAWLKLDPDSGTIVGIPERVAIVQRIFRETLEGKGQHQIAQTLNREGIQPWGGGAYWQRSYIAKILENDAVIGMLRPHTIEYRNGKRERVPQEPVEGYFPPAVSLEVWQEVRAFKEGKHSRARGRHSAAPITNTLAGMACCPICGGTMMRTNKGARSRPSFVCARAKNKAGCQYRSVRVDVVEDAIVSRLPARLRAAPAGERNPVLDNEIANLEADSGVLQDRISAIVSAIEVGGEAGTLVTRLRDLENEYAAASRQLSVLEGRRAATAGATVHARISRLLAALEPEEGQPTPGEVNLALQSVFRRVTLDYRQGLLVFEWLHGGSVDLPFALPEET